jgi:hypothetical protein
MKAGRQAARPAASAPPDRPMPVSSAAAHHQALASSAKSSADAPPNQDRIRT